MPGPRSLWTERGDVVDAIAAYAGWHPQLRGILESVDETFVWGLFDRPPMQHWSVGRVTLLGDACHAMLPFMAQGAAQAIEDGATLAACLAKAGQDSIVEALSRYERSRLPRTARVQALAFGNKRASILRTGRRSCPRFRTGQRRGTLFVARRRLAATATTRHNYATPNNVSGSWAEEIDSSVLFEFEVREAGRNSMMMRTSNSAH